MNDYLKEERNRLNLKQREIAIACDVTERTVIKWESGSPIPSDKLAVLASLGFDIQYVVLGKRIINRTIYTGHVGLDKLERLLQYSEKKVKELDQYINRIREAVEMIKKDSTPPNSE